MVGLWVVVFRREVVIVCHMRILRKSSWKTDTTVVVCAALFLLRVYIAECKSCGVCE